MININLLIRPKPRLRWPVVFGGVTGALLIGGLAWGGYLGLTHLNSARQVNTQYRLLAEDYSHATKALPDLQQRLDQGKERLAVFEEMGRNQRRSQADWLAAVAGVTPEGVKLTEVSFSERYLTITGQASSFEKAITFLHELRGLTHVEAMSEEHSLTVGGSHTTFTFRAWSHEEVEQR